MIRRTIAQRNTANQDKIFNSMEGEINLKEKAFNSFVSNIIREYGVIHSDGYYLPISKLPYLEKKQFLSYLVPAIDYKYFVENKTREELAIKDYQDEMEYFIEINKDRIYYEDMEEMGLLLCHHKDNGESFWIGK